MRIPLFLVSLLLFSCSNETNSETIISTPEINQIENNSLISDGLIVHYRMNGNADDSSGNNLHATTVTAQLTEDRFGHPNSAYSFNGVNQYIDMPSNSLLRPGLPVTISYWFKRRSLIAQKNSIFILNFTDNHYYGVFSSITLNNVEVSFGNGGTTNPNGRNSVYGNTSIELNSWYFVLCVIRGTNDFDLYVNEFNDESPCGVYSCCNDDYGYNSGTSTTLVYNTDHGSIGRYDSHTSYPPNYFDGDIDEFRIWNRELTQTEIRYLCKYERFIVGSFYN